MRRMNGSTQVDGQDFLAAEEPMEIQVEGHSVAVVMRTPGDDFELAAGFLVTEGLVHSASDIADMRYQWHCLGPARRGRRRKTSKGSAPADAGLQAGPGTSLQSGNTINVLLSNPDSLDLKRLTRHVFTSSSCGICSKASIDAVRQQFPPVQDSCEVDPQVLLGLPRSLARSQQTFKFTGGLHACALFDLSGKLLVVREDVGRHNALDKVVGWALLGKRLPLHGHIVLLSGRTSFEMMQKALAGGIPIVAAISAPSSLAVEFAQASGQTLAGFLRGERMNIYAGGERVRPVTTTRPKKAALLSPAAH